MAVHYRSQGFILLKEDLREADQVFSVYTKEFGKLKILGKAIRKIKSKLRSGAELFYLSEIEFIQGKNYKTLTDAITVEKFKNIRGDLDRLKIAYQISEVADSLIRGQEEDKEIWNLLKEVFEKLEKSNNFSLLYYYFLWNLFSILGYQIDFYNCVICQKKLMPSRLYFNLKEGGIVCSNCSNKVEILEEISLEIIKILRIFLKKDWHTLPRLKIRQEHKKALKLISENYLSYFHQEEKKPL